MTRENQGELLSQSPQPASEPPPPLPADSLAVLQRMEQTLVDIRRSLAAEEREAQHREYSPGPLVASITQVLVVALLLWGVLDWSFAAPPANVLVKLGFATVLQLIALTAFLLGRD